jgi:hypothetical protein
MAGLFEDALMWMRSPQRSQQMQGVGNTVYNRLNEANAQAAAFNQLSKQDVERFLQTGDIYGPEAQQMAASLAAGYNPVGMVGARFKGSGAVPTDVPMYGKAKEITDQFSEISPEMIAKATQIFGKDKVTLGDILKHPELYRDYPELAKYPVKGLGLFSDPNTKAAYGGGNVYLPTNSKNISSDKLKDIHSSVLHEVQHAIQEIDKMPTGASPDMFMKKGWGKAMDKTNALENQTRESLDEYVKTKYPDQNMSWAAFLFNTNKSKELVASDPKLKELVGTFNKAKELRTKLQSQADNAYNSYKNVAGEAQARAIQQRFLNPEQYQRPVTESYDIPLMDLRKSPLDSSIK